MSNNNINNFVIRHIFTTIFGFSSPNSTQSSGISRKITNIIYASLDEIH